MKFGLIFAAALLVLGVTSWNIADVVDVQPADSYSTVLEQSGWTPAQKVYSLANTSYDWVYWHSAAPDGKVMCQPHGGWIAPGASVDMTICPDASMATAEPGTYTDQVTINFDPRLAGDVNGDTVVDVLDLLAVADAWNTTSADPAYDPAGDFNNDGAVNTVDLLEISNSWGRTYGGTAI